MLDKYLSLITSEHYNKPKFTQWMTAALTKGTGTSEVMTNLPDDFDLDRAVGLQLDVIGQLVGVKRMLNFQPSSGSAVLDDATYRLVIRAKIAQNQWDGTMAGLETIWKAVLPNDILIAFDNQDMSMTIMVPTLQSELIGELIKHDYIVPRPMGVLLNYSISEFPFFAYANAEGGYAQGLAGYGEGTWVEVTRG